MVSKKKKGGMRRDHRKIDFVFYINRIIYFLTHRWINLTNLSSLLKIGI